MAYLPVTRHLFTDSLASVILLASLVLFLVFAWLNRRLPGMPILIVGLLLNFMVIAANGGWMPISPQTADFLIGKDVLQVMNLGDRIGEKDILLSAQNTHFEFLADRFLLPAWLPYRTAFSLGDILIGLGAFWLLAKPIEYEYHEYHEYERDWCMITSTEFKGNLYGKSDISEELPHAD